MAGITGGSLLWRHLLLCCLPKIHDYSIERQPHDPLEEVIGKVGGHLRRNSGSAQIIAIKAPDGMGKSRILKLLRDEFTNHVGSRGDLFDVVLFATVSRHNSMLRLQEDLIHQLGLSSQRHPDASELCVVYAKKLSSKLSNKRFLLLLDDVEEKLDLASLGIPTSESENMNWKVVITTRSSDAHQALGAHHVVQVRPLNPRQSSKLFWTNVGSDAVRDDPRIRELGMQIVDHCLGLPLALVTMGWSMSAKRHRASWEDAVNDLQQMLDVPQDSEQLREGMDPVLCSALCFAYKSLKTDQMRKCLLYCSLFPDGREINGEQLIEYWVGEGLLDVSENVYSLHLARNEGHKVIETLLSSGLLQKGDRDDENSVKLHDAVRLMAQSIGFVVTDGENKFVAPTQITGDDDKWAKATWASLMTQGESIGLSQRFHSSLSSLLISRGDEPGNTQGGAPTGSSSLAIGGLFQLVPGLRVLDLSGTLLEVVPPSIALLSDLQYLNLSGTKIRSLPTELGKLIKLRQLILTSTRRLSMIPHEAISSLGQLQLLNAYLSAYYWCGRDRQGNEASMQILEDLCGLNELGLNLKDLNALQRLIESTRLHGCTRFLTVSGVEDLTAPHLSKAFKMLRSLQELSVSSCQKLEEFTVEDDQLPLLDVLKLDNLPLSAVAAAAPSTGALINLRRLDISYCNSLKSLMWAGRLPSLEELHVVFCDGMEELLGKDTDLDSFPKLSSMHLGHLPLLRCVSGRTGLLLPSLERLEIENCPRLTVLPFGHDTTKKLKRVHGEAAWWSQLTWDDCTAKESLQDLFWPRSLPEDSMPFDTSSIRTTGGSPKNSEVAERPARVEHASSSFGLPNRISCSTRTRINRKSKKSHRTVGSSLTARRPRDDYRDILSRSVTPAGFATGEERSGLLREAILIDGGEKSFWLDKATGKRCYMVSVTGLRISGGNDRSQWSSGGHINSRFTQVAELLSICWLDVQGKMKVQDLSPGTVYTASLVHQLRADDHGLEDPLTGWVTVAGHRSERTVCFHPSDEEPRPRRDGWTELRLGEFPVNGGGDDETVHFSLKEVERLNWKGGLVIEGIEVRPVRMESPDAGRPVDESEAERLLPADYEEILSRCVDRPNFSTKLELYNLLCDSILIDGGQKSFAVERTTGKKRYVLSARDLSITWGDDQRYWRWESQHKNSRFSEVAELLMICWLDINGKLETRELSPHTTYAAYLIFHCTDKVYGFNDSQKASVAVGATVPERRSVYLRPVKYESFASKRSDGWMEMELGDFDVHPDANDEDAVEFGLQEVKRLNWKGGLIIEGIEIKPKNMES